MSSLRGNILFMVRLESSLNLPTNADREHLESVCEKASFSKKMHQGIFISIYVVMKLNFNMVQSLKDH